MFDLKLFSKAANDYITKLDNGSFEVKIYDWNSGDFGINVSLDIT